VDLLLIARKIWLHKFATLPILALTVLGAVMVLVVKGPVYQASSTHILINPPTPPSAEDVARDPALGRINADNPYTRFPDQSVGGQVLASALTSESARRELVAAGADRRYSVAPTAEFGYSAPIIKVVGVGPSPEVAIATTKLVDRAVIRQLDRMQQAEGVDEHYRITTQQVDFPDSAELQASGQLRALVGVLALGTLLLFVVVSVADALAQLREGRTRRSAESPLSEFDDGDWRDVSFDGPSNGGGKAPVPSQAGSRRSVGRT